MNYYTQPLTKNQMTSLDSLALSLGLKGTPGRFREYPRFLMTDGRYGYDFDHGSTNSRSSEEVMVDFPAMAKLIAERSKEELKSVKLNNEYTATLEGEEIVVGCQRFPKEKIKEVYEKLIKE